MHDALVTRPSLLARLRDPHDHVAWQQFVQMYGDLVYHFARRRGLQDADAADLTQEVLQAVAKAMDHWQYDRAQGTFRGWVYALTRNHLARFYERRRRQPIGTGDSNAQQRLNEQTDRDSDLEATWDQEYRRQLFVRAAEQVRGRFAETTWQAFWQTAVEGKSAAEVGAALGLTVGAVYVAKSRVLAQIAEQVQQLDSE